MPNTDVKRFILSFLLDNLSTRPTLRANSAAFPLYSNNVRPKLFEYSFIEPAGNPRELSILSVNACHNSFNQIEVCSLDTLDIELRLKGSIASLYVPTRKIFTLTFNLLRASLK